MFPRLVLLVLLLLSASSFCQNPKTSQQLSRKAGAKSGAAHTAASGKPVAAPALAVPFDALLTQLPSHFNGHSAKQIYDRFVVLGAKKEKSEFETTADYENRKISVGRQGLFGGVTSRSTVAFVIEESPYSFEGFSSKYDADSQELTATLTARPKRLYLESDQPELLQIPLASYLRESDKYIGSNAFGASVKISRSYYDDYGIVLDPDTWPFENSSDKFQPSAEFKVHLDPEVAPKVKGNLRMLLLGTLKQPWIRDDVEGHEPTIDSPYDTNHSWHLLEFVPRGIWLFDYSSGAILEKVVPKEDSRFALEVSCSGVATLNVTLDGGPENIEIIEGAKTFRALARIGIKVQRAEEMSTLSFKLNGEPVSPNWVQDSDSIGGHTFFNSAVVTFLAPSASKTNYANP